MNLNRKNFSTTIAGREFSLEISDLADQTNGSVLAKYGDTVVLATAVMGKIDQPGDFFPLTVNYEEKFYAAGKILGSRFVRREGKTSDEAVLSGRLIDRSIRPLFNERLRREVQVVLTIFSIDEKNDPDFVSLIAASAALAISDIPWSGPVGGVQVAKIDGELKINPLIEEIQKGKISFNAFFSGIKGKINMIEISGFEANEEEIVDGMKTALMEIENLISFQEKIVKEVGKDKTAVALLDSSPEFISAVKNFLTDKLEKSLYLKEKTARESAVSKVKEEFASFLSESEFSEEDLKHSEIIFEEIVNDIVHKNVIEKEKRVDGRKLDEIRPLYSEVKLFERTHGTGLFMRGETHALAVTTIAPPGQEKLEETMEDIVKKRFFLHYNFPPYAVGEIKQLRGPGRREIGHGALAEKALRPMVPSTDVFPYTVRVVSEVVSSNGSSSMATVCAGCLSLMDAGVPLKKPVAGIAMGIMSDSEGNYKILTDIQGPEDHYGDMDFKVAGTRDGVTAVQLDVKIDGVTPEILREGLNQAKVARLEILSHMEKTLSAPRPEISKYAPQVSVVKINPEKIGELIGPGGKVINGIIDRTGATIDIDDDGTVYVGGTTKESLEAALREVKSITKDFEVGEIVEGSIVRILEFGAIVDLGGGKDGMIHVSELKEGFVKNVEDVLKVGDFVRAKVIKKDNGKLGLSIKQLK
ncbi:MAG: polyribonucleotide nucleotidyltransferase [Candidatus Pacebacteria bacterium]|nr:polyribonucleotide nucleotidyltransferase [Candidatus Paceibacterota bacterium]